MWQRWRYLQVIFVVLTVFTGLLPLRFHQKKWRLWNTRPMQVCATVHNVLVLVGLPWHIKFSLEAVEKYESFPMSALAGLLIAVVRVLSIVLIVGMRWRCERSLGQIMDELSYLEENYFKKLPDQTNRSRSLDFMLYVKMALMVYYLGYTIHVVVILLRKGLLFTSISVFPMVKIMNLLHLLMFHYFVLLWHMIKCFRRLNDQLHVILRKAQYLGGLLSKGSRLLQRELFCELATELFELSATHAKFRRLFLALNDSFKFHLLTLVASAVVYTVYTGYNLVLVLSGHASSESFAELFVSMSVYVTMYFNSFLGENLINRIAQTSTETVDILQSYKALPPTDVLFERSSEQLSLQLIGRKTFISLFGLFDLSRQSFFTMLAQMSLYVIYLVQTDYMIIYV